jgi:hypothetical protein
MSRSQILGALTFTTFLVAVLAACSSNTGGSAVMPLAAPPSTTTTTSAKAAAPACLDFAASTFIGAGLNKANDVKPMGWSIQLWDKAGSPSWEYSAGTTWTIGGVAKDTTTCLARFEVVGLTTTTATTPPPPPPAPTGPLTTVSDGNYLVGTDMVAGSFKSPGPEDSRLGCYWERSRDDAGDKIIANDYTKGPARFTAKKGELVSITNCTFTKV